MKIFPVCCPAAFGRVDWYSGRFTLDEPSELNGEPGVKFLTIPDPAKRYAISAPFSKTFSPKDQTVVIQYVLSSTLFGFDGCVCQV